MKQLVLAEKPSVGRELARVLGCANRGKYLESDEYVVTWALGHLVTLCPPDHYGEQYRHWNLRNLPILPKKLETMVIDKSKEQYEIVKGLLDRDDVEGVIIATDAGREGELVARWILKQAGCTKPAKRLWISSQTDMAIKQGFANLRPASDYDNLFAAAESRSYADWYVGYNVSRAMSCYFDTRLSAGRVQTPTLALITKREDEIEDFAGRFYWTLKADFGSFKASWYSQDNTIRIPEEAKANELAAKLKGAKGSVTSVKVVPKAEKPPLAYDLTELQRDANNMLGFSAKETLDTLQRLYEVHKIVTYPRTDSRYITADIVPTIPDRLNALSATSFGLRAASYLRNGIRTDLSRLVNDALVSDHHALLPTEQKVDVSKLSSSEKALWELIITRFMETLSADYEYSTTTVEATVDGERFVARLTVPVKQGWRDVAREIGKRSAVALEEGEDDDPGILSLKEGSELEIKDVVLKRNATLPPDRYTEADLLFAMEHAGRFVEDAELKSHLENGLGTPATRADIIEKLIQNNCIERKDKELVPTAKGRELVRLVPQQLRSADLTGKWEQRLSSISKGTESEEPFIEDIKKNATDLVNQVVSSRDKFDPNLMGDKTRLCPHCGWPMVNVLDEYERTHHVCQRFSCGYEEMEVKKRVEVAPAEVTPTHASASPVKRVIATASPSSSGKKTIVIHKGAVKAAVAKATPQVKWETVIEVVKPSHYRPRREDQGERKSSFEPRRQDFRKPEPRKDFARRDERKREDRKPYESRESSSGGTFADFIKASEERKKRDEEKRKAKGK
ncbi:MAG: DNA topoisomerase 3 [Spirochaetales bacterium]|nr:DNA topoisomerase 3 [Spirochaetales bacterium]